MKSFPRFILTALVLIPLANNGQKINLPTAVYQSDALLIIPLTENVYVHTSFLHSKTFGKVPCNGMIVVNKQQAVIFDTPT
ncbi:MAG: subclass B1 metallo-beta-lactamase, partial [Ginsengibacter sp.]